MTNTNIPAGSILTLTAAAVALLGLSDDAIVVATEDTAPGSTLFVSVDGGAPFTLTAAAVESFEAPAPAPAAEAMLPCDLALGSLQVRIRVADDGEGYWIGGRDVRFYSPMAANLERAAQLLGVKLGDVQVGGAYAWCVVPAAAFTSKLAKVCRDAAATLHRGAVWALCDECQPPPEALAARVGELLRGRDPRTPEELLTEVRPPRTGDGKRPTQAGRRVHPGSPGDASSVIQARSTPASEAPSHWCRSAAPRPRRS